MYTFQLYIRTENASFHDEIDGDYSPERELSRILRVIAEKVSDGETDLYHFQTIFDENGNDVGRFALKETD